MYISNAGGSCRRAPGSVAVQPASLSLDPAVDYAATPAGSATGSGRVERVAAIRELVGPDFPLMADANMRWQVHEAIRAARALAAHRV